MATLTFRDITLLFALTTALYTLTAPPAAASGVNIDISIGDRPDHVADDHHRNGPPDHAPAHGYRAKHHYHYYPASEVYFDTGSRMYFYLSNNTWRASASIPIALQARLGDHVTIELDSDRPYTHHDEHKRKYGHGHNKNKGKEHKRGKHDD